MIKSDLIEKIAAKHMNYSSEQIATAVNSMIEIIAEALAKGERIEIRGFGSFSLHYQNERTAHNPKTGEKIITPGKFRPHFKPGKELRDRVNQKS